MEIVSFGKDGDTVMFKSGFEVDMIGLILLSLSAEDGSNELVIKLTLVNTNARRSVRINMDFNCFMFMEICHIISIQECKNQTK